MHIYICLKRLFKILSIENMFSVVRIYKIYAILNVSNQDIFIYQNYIYLGHYNLRTLCTQELFRVIKFENLGRYY